MLVTWSASSYVRSFPRLQWWLCIAAATNYIRLHRTQKLCWRKIRWKQLRQWPEAKHYTRLWFRMCVGRVTASRLKEVCHTDQAFPSETLIICPSVTQSCSSLGLPLPHGVASMSAQYEKDIWFLIALCTASSFLLQTLDFHWHWPHMLLQMFVVWIFIGIDHTCFSRCLLFLLWMSNQGTYLLNNYNYVFWGAFTTIVPILVLWGVYWWSCG